MRRGSDGIRKTYRGVGAIVAKSQRQAGGSWLKVEGLNDRVGDGKLLEVYGGAVRNWKGGGDDGGN